MNHSKETNAGQVGLDKHLQLTEWYQKEKLRGYYNYYGLTGNNKMLKKMGSIVKRLLYKWLNRRSQRRSFTWKEFKE